MAAVVGVGCEVEGVLSPYESRWRHLSLARVCKQQQIHLPYRNGFEHKGVLCIFCMFDSVHGINTNRFEV